MPRGVTSALVLKRLQHRRAVCRLMGHLQRSRTAPLGIVTGMRFPFGRLMMARVGVLSLYCSAPLSTTEREFRVLQNSSYSLIEAWSLATEQFSAATKAGPPAGLDDSGQLALSVSGEQEQAEGRLIPPGPHRHAPNAPRKIEAVTSNRLHA